MHCPFFFILFFNSLVYFLSYTKLNLYLTYQLRYLMVLEDKEFRIHNWYSIIFLSYLKYILPAFIFRNGGIWEEHGDVLASGVVSTKFHINGRLNNFLDLDFVRVIRWIFFVWISVISRSQSKQLQIFDEHGIFVTLKAMNLDVRLYLSDKLEALQTRRHFA